MRRIIVVAGALFVLVVGLFLLRSLADALYFAERRQLQHQIATDTGLLADYHKARVDHKKVKAEIQHLVDRTRGGNLETVEPRLRTRLTRLAERAGMTPPSSGNGTSRAKESPAKSAFSRAGLQRQLREEPDFVEVEGW